MFQCIRELTRLMHEMYFYQNHTRIFHTGTMQPFYRKFNVLYPMVDQAYMQAYA